MRRWGIGEIRKAIFATRGGIYCLVFLVAFAVAAIITTLCPHAPRIHDEFSYLLSADTILHGRLANPTPPVWEPLQSFHVIVAPSYASKYPLGQGLVIALGWALVGLPIAGCWLAAGLCASSITWMLHGLVSRRWALVGGAFVALHPMMQTTWSQSLMSGWLTAAGCALLTGGIFRCRRRVARIPAVMLGLGVALLALTRPFEGLACTLISAAFLWILWSPRTLLQKVKLAGITAAYAASPVVLALTITGLQNQATTGKWHQMPYQVHEAQYGVAPLFVFGTPKTPEFENSGETINSYHLGWSLDSYLARQGIMGWLSGIAEGFRVILRYVGFPVVLISVITVPLWISSRVGQGLAIMLLTQSLVSGAVCWVFPHYLAPVVPWLIALAVLGSRRALHSIANCSVRVDLRRLTSKSVVFALAAQAILLGLRVGGKVVHPHRSWAHERVSIKERLDQTDGKDLVLVTYSADHNVHEEWVYNEADIENASVVWARSENKDWHARLVDQYQEKRYIWELWPDVNTELHLLSSPSEFRFTPPQKPTIDERKTFSVSVHLPSDHARAESRQ